MTEKARTVTPVFDLIGETIVLLIVLQDSHPPGRHSHVSYLPPYIHTSLFVPRLSEHESSSVPKGRGGVTYKEMKKGFSKLYCNLDALGLENEEALCSNATHCWGNLARLPGLMQQRVFSHSESVTRRINHRTLLCEGYALRCCLY